MPTITDKTKVKALLGITTDENDALFDLLCSWVSDYIESYCSISFTEKQIVDEIYSSADFKFVFWLTKSPVKTLTSIKKKVDDNWKTLVEGDDYEIVLDSGMITMDEIDNGISDLKVSYTAGRDIPGAIEMVATQLVVSAFNRRSNQGVKSENLGDASIQWGDMISNDQKEILGRYSRGTSFIA